MTWNIKSLIAIIEYSEAHRGASVQSKEINVVGRKFGPPYSKDFGAKTAVERSWPKMKHGSDVTYPVSEMMLHEIQDTEPRPWEVLREIYWRVLPLVSLLYFLSFVVSYGQLHSSCF